MSMKVYRDVSDARRHARLRCLTFRTAPEVASAIAPCLSESAQGYHSTTNQNADGTARAKISNGLGLAVAIIRILQTINQARPVLPGITLIERQPPATRSASRPFCGRSVTSNLSAWQA